VKIHCIWTRDLDVPYSAGRLKVARRIRAALNASEHQVSHHVLTTIMDTRHPGDWARAALNARLGLPLQCWLFDTAHNRRIADAIPNDVDVVYLDGIRTVRLLQQLRERLPRARLIIDLDDLMSRRTDILLQAGEGFSPGYLTEKFPKWLATALQRTAGIVLRYERAGLRRWEDRACDLADEVVLLSPYEAKLLRDRLKTVPRAAIRAIPPPEAVIRAPQNMSAPARFVFIGMDTLTQNRLTIEYLLDIWKRTPPPLPLHIYGKMSRTWPKPPNVFFHGYVDTLAEVYDGRSILLTPSFVGGGVKTKVIEAFAWGTPVIGNDNTFEGMQLASYPLCQPTERLESGDFLSRQSIGKLNDAVRIGSDYVRRHHDPDRFASTWRRILAGPLEVAAAD
jgi:glycosyltransferase involved in cell wall biosynthesis